LRKPGCILAALSTLLAIACLINGETVYALLIASTIITLELVSRWAGLEDYRED
jgi:hypothetical protein